MRDFFINHFYYFVGTIKVKVLRTKWLPFLSFEELLSSFFTSNDPILYVNLISRSFGSRFLCYRLSVLLAFERSQGCTCDLWSVHQGEYALRNWVVLIIATWVLRITYLYFVLPFLLSIRHRGLSITRDSRSILQFFQFYTY